MNTATMYQDLLLATGEQSRETDRQTIESFGIPGETLMEIAGNRAADLIMAGYPFTSGYPLSEESNSAQGRDGHGMEDRGRTDHSGVPHRHPLHVLFVCGKGNNAGDAFVIARILMSYGYHVSLFPLMGTNGLSPDAQRNFDRLMRLSREMEAEIPVHQKWPAPDTFDLIVDGIFGTGLEREIGPPVAGSIEKINRSGKPVIALDIPSGIHSETGEVLGCAVQAEKTIQFGVRKLGCYLGDAPVYCGDRMMVRLPFPPVYKEPIRMRLVDMSLQPERALHPRNRVMAGPGGRPTRVQKHKYNNGVVHVIGGSPGLTGAPLYAARAAWSLGMGAVTLIYPAAWSIPMDSQAPQLIKKPIGDFESDFFTEEDAEPVLSWLDEKEGVVVIGPGIGREEETAAFVRRVIAGCPCPMIIDADALHCLPEYGQIISGKEHPGQVILTPHPGELAMLTGETSGSDHERLMNAAALSERLGCVVLSKGNPTFVHSPTDQQALVTPYETTVFSRAGFGDTLAGHLAAFLSRTGQPLESCEHALLYGYNKINEVTSAGKAFPEPSDLT